MQIKRNLFQEERLTWARQRGNAFMSSTLLDRQEERKEKPMVEKKSHETAKADKVPAIPAALLHRLERHLHDFRVNNPYIL